MKTIDLVIPVYNEQKALKNTFTTLNRWTPPSTLKITKVIFANDGSTDQSLKLLKNLSLKFPKQIISYSQNKGKGFAVKKAMLTSQANYAILLDADMATHPNQLEKFTPYIQKNIPIVIGTRKNGHSTVTIHQPLIRELLGKVFTKISQLILQVNVTDFTCGFKAFSKSARQKIFTRSLINRWGYDSEILFLASLLNLRIQEKSVTWAHQDNSKVNPLKDALTSLKELIQIRLNQLMGKYHLHPLHIPKIHLNPVA